MKPFRRKPVQRERTEQAHGVNLVTSLGGKAYVLGTTRQKKCWQCGAQSRDMSTRQTPGVGDVYLILPAPRLKPLVPRSRLVWWEAKAPETRDASGRKVRGGTATKDQQEFRDLVLGAGGAHVLGDLQQLLVYLIEGGWLKSDNIPHYRRPSMPVAMPLPTLTQE